MPLIAIAGQEQKVQNYAAALAGAGMTPLIGLDRARAGTCDGLLLPGGGDMDPARFGQADRGSRDIDPALDAAQLAILEDFVRRGRPVLGICRGHQVLNVYFGGSLIQDLPTAAAHMARNGADSVHPARTVPGSVLHRLYGPEMTVNSAHHQGLDALGDGLWATAFAPDGTVEAAEHRSLPILSVQFHPERMAFAHARPDTADGRALFQWLRERL